MRKTLPPTAVWRNSSFVFLGKYSELQHFLLHFSLTCRYYAKRRNVGGNIMTHIDLKYNTENLKEWELKSLSEKNELGKFTFKFLLSISFGLFVFILLSPYFPPLRPGNKFNPPKSLSEYFDDISITAIIICSILFLTFGFEFVRNKIDNKSKIKKVGNFEIKGLLNLGRQTFVLMNNFNFLFIKSNYAGLKNAKKGQIITVKKTATNKTFSIYIRDKSKFETE